MLKHAALIAAGIVGVSLVLSAWMVSHSLRQLGQTMERISKEAGRGPQLILADDAIRPGDIVEVRLNDLMGPGQETIRTVRPGTDGKISLPYLAELSAGGKTPGQLEKAISTAYSEAKIANAMIVGVSARRIQ